VAGGKGMTAQELIDLLSQLDPNKEVLLYDGAWDRTNSIYEVKIDEDDNIVIW
jgi:hypothetical protein